MKWPIVYTCALPFLIGVFLGTKVMSGTLLGLIVAGLLLGISTQTSGAAWMNTSSYISTGANKLSEMAILLGSPLCTVVCSEIGSKNYLHCGYTPSLQKSAYVLPE
jgi:hypothetical protein